MLNIADLPDTFDGSVEHNIAFAMANQGMTRDKAKVLAGNAKKSGIVARLEAGETLRMRSPESIRAQVADVEGFLASLVDKREIDTEEGDEPPLTEEQILSELIGQHRIVESTPPRNGRPVLGIDDDAINFGKRRSKGRGKRDS